MLDEFVDWIREQNRLEQMSWDMSTALRFAHLHQGCDCWSTPLQDIDQNLAIR
jgi:hypothetical protein